MTSAQSRKVPGRPSLTRKSTKGPLDSDDDPLSLSVPSPLCPSSSTTSPLVRSIDFGIDDNALSGGRTVTEPTHDSKDLSFLLDTAIYHPLGQLDIPQPLRKPFPTPAPVGTDLAEVFTQLEQILSQCQFLSAAHLASLVLISGNVSSTDAASIFRLLSIRFSCLELSGNVSLAAQESKALEDLASTFYYDDNTLPAKTASIAVAQRPMPRHIMPFDLRCQAIRLQAIGFSDLRRGISALYDLGLECRDNLSAPVTTDGERQVWSGRLQEVGFRTVNALVEMGDLECAQRVLASLKPSSEGEAGTWAVKMVLLLLKIGDISGARTIVHESTLAGSDRAALQSLLSVAEGRYADAIKTLSDQLQRDTDGDVLTLARQNLAVAYLYTGEMAKCKAVLEQLIDERGGYQVLVTNLATLYELSSDRARELKIGLATKVSDKSAKTPRHAFVNADFRL